ncbi:MAG: sigma-70 family RNA polymerase sigma factor, partial [Alphaproteobacteria bacterium]
MTAYEDSETRRANIAFIKRSMETPLLTREHEYALARAWRDECNDAALHELINAYNRLVVSTAGRFKNYGLPVGDLIQEGVVGLLHAANRFEPDRDVRFSTYASWWIRSAMQDFILRNWSIVRTGTTASQKSLFFNLRRLRSKIEESTGEQLNQDGRVKIAETLGVPLRDVEAMEGRLSAADGSLNAVIGED